MLSTEYEVLSESFQTRTKRNAGLTYFILVAIFSSIPVGTYSVTPTFFPRFRSTVEVAFLNAVEYCFLFPVSMCHTLSLIFSLGAKSPVNREDGEQ
jgi:hypothetical protein